jgi:hypothetical protein
MLQEDGEHPTLPEDVETLMGESGLTQVVRLPVQIGAMQGIYAVPTIRSWWVCFQCDDLMVLSIDFELDSDDEELMEELGYCHDPPG